MSANKNASVCVATSPRPLIEVDGNRTGQDATGLLNRAAPTSYVRHRRRTRCRNAADQRTTGRYAAGRGSVKITV